MNVSNLIHYLPHQPVIREDKGKVRIVYDASAKCGKNGVSLNELLEPGPVLLENLIGVLLRFRFPKIVIACDIEKAFLQAAVNERDRDVTRFLWVRDPFGSVSEDNLIVYRFKRVAFGLTCSPFLLAATILVHFEKNPSTLANEIKPNIYVDNILLNADDTRDGSQKCLQAKELFLKGGMNLREYVSNSSECLKELSEKDKLPGVHHKFLGIPWDTSKDSLSLKLPSVSSSKVTKRSVLSCIASLFDPCRLLSPVVLSAKLFFQDLWEKKLNWDEEVDEESQKRWSEVIGEWNSVSVEMDRMVIGIPQATNFELHCFVDASEKAFACCVYVVARSSRSASSNLVFAKAKVKPVRYVKSEMSIHRLELLGTLIGCRAVKFVRQELNRDDSIARKLSEESNVWTDSSTVLHWLRSTAKQEIFVSNRLHEIRSVNKLRVRYICTDENPADIATRGCKVDEIKQNTSWWHGPNWLTTNGRRFDDNEAKIPYFDSEEYEKRMLKNKCGNVTLNVVQNKMLVDSNRFSSWYKLLNCVAYVLRFIRNLTRSMVRVSTSKWLNKVEGESGTFSVGETKIAKLFLIFEAQSTFPPSKAERENLSLFKDEWKILRSKGRIENSETPYSTQNPIYLPPKSHTIFLLVYSLHLCLMHAGPTTTITELRAQFWLPKGRQTVREIVRKFCVACKRISGPLFRATEFPCLPRERVKETSVFENCGIDYMGPLSVKRNGEIVKVWIVLFTCMVVRAIHLELVFNLSAESFIGVLRKFVARRGMPRKIFSDKGTQFVLTEKTLDKKFLDEWNEIRQDNFFLEYLHKNGIQWKFITEHAPWRGGFYERLIGIVKENLRRTIGRTVMEAERLAVLVTEIENVVNSRPITFCLKIEQIAVPSDP